MKKDDIEISWRDMRYEDGLVIQCPLFHIHPEKQNAIVLLVRGFESRLNSSDHYMKDFASVLKTLFERIDEKYNVSAKSLIIVPIPNDSEAEVVAGILRSVAKKNYTLILSGWTNPPQWDNCSFPDNKFSRLQKGIVYGKEINLIYTMNIAHVLNKDVMGKKGPDKFNTNIMMVGFLMRDFATAMRGSNLYTITHHDTFKYKQIDSMKKWKLFYDFLVKSPVVSIDTETDNLNVVANRLLTIQFSLDGQSSFLLPFLHPETPFSKSEIDTIRNDLKQYFTFGKSQFHVYHNAKFDLHQLFRELGLTIYNHYVYDTQAGEFCLDENRKDLARFVKFPYSLESISKEYGSDAYSVGGMSKNDRANIAKQSLKDLSEYGGKDVIIPYQVALFQLAEAKRRGPLYRKFEKTVKHLLGNTIKVFVTMEKNGFLVDVKYLSWLGENAGPIRQKQFEALKKINAMPHVQATNLLINRKKNNPTRGLYGEIKQPWLFDVSKPEHLGMLFFGVMNLKPRGLRKNNEGQVDDKFFGFYKNLEEVKMIESYRSISTIETSFRKPLWKYSHVADSADSRIRSDFGFLRVRTNRSSSSKPNLQNIPTRGEFAKIIKRAFIIRPDYIGIKGDYNAHEVGGLANIAKDKTLIKSFELGRIIRRKLRIWFYSDPERDMYLAKFLESKSDNVPPALKQAIDWLKSIKGVGDVHRRNYSFFFNVPAESVTDKQRNDVKAVVFGVIYGLMAASLSKQIFAQEYAEIEKEPDTYMQERSRLIAQAQELTDKMFDTFKDAKIWLDKMYELGSRFLEIESPLGVVRHLWGYVFDDKIIKGLMDRRGPNSIIQGFSSNIIYLGSYEMYGLIFRAMQKNIDLKYNHVNIIHDSHMGESHIENVPINLYFLEHSLTTLAARVLKTEYEWDIPMGFEMAFEMYGLESSSIKYDMSLSSMKTSIEHVMKTTNKELGYTWNDGIVGRVLQKAEKINKVRKEELKLHGNLVSPETRMLITPETMHRYGL